MKKEHTTKQERRRIQSKRAARNRDRGRKTLTAWVESSFCYASEVAEHLSYRFVQLNEKVVSPIGMPSKQYIRRKVAGMSRDQLEELRDSLLESTGGKLTPIS